MMASQAKDQLTFHETDEADSPTATYVFSRQDVTIGSRGRVDVIVGLLSSLNLDPVNIRLAQLRLLIMCKSCLYGKHGGCSLDESLCGHISSSHGYPCQLSSIDQGTFIHSPSE